MAYLGQAPNKSVTTPTSQSFNGDGSTTAFTLNRGVNYSEELEVFVDNIQQEPGTGKSYTASGTTLTFDEAPATGTGNIYVIYRGQAQVGVRLEHDANASISATDGTFSGNVSATDGTFSGDVTAVDGTFSGNVSVTGNATVDSGLTVAKTTYGDIISIKKGNSEVGKISTASAGATFDTGDFTYGPDKIGGFGNLKRDSFASGGRDYHQLGRFIFFPHADGTSTQDFDVNKDFGMTDTGGFVMLMGHGWMTDHVYGMVEWRNAGGGDGITNVYWREILRDGLTVTVGVTPNTNGQSIRITLGSIHNNSHGWQVFVMCPR